METGEDCRAAVGQDVAEAQAEAADFGVGLAVVEAVGLAISFGSSFAVRERVGLREAQPEE